MNEQFTAQNKQIVFFAGSFWKLKNMRIKIVFRKSPKRPLRELLRYLICMLSKQYADLYV